MEQILEEELEALNVSYLERIIEKVLPSWTVTMGASIPIIKMERPMEDKEVKAAYWYHSWWRDTQSRVKSFDEKANGDNPSPVGKQIEKMTRGGQGGFYPQEDLVPSCFQGRWREW
jgi:hypothetical protein